MRTSTEFTRGPIAIPPGRLLANEIHRFFSIKAGMRYVTCESPMEADAIYLMEGDPSVEWLCEQGLRINRTIGTKPYYTFDLATRSRQVEIAWEVRPEEQLEPAKDGVLKPKHWDELEAACAEIDFTCRFLTNRHFDEKAQLIENWKVLLPFACKAYKRPDTAVLDLLRDECARCGTVSLRVLRSVATRTSDDVFVSHVAYLLHRGEASCDLDALPITWNSKLTGSAPA